MFIIIIIFFLINVNTQVKLLKNDFFYAFKNSH
jgi:hypothetical protein